MDGRPFYWSQVETGTKDVSHDEGNSWMSSALKMNLKTGIAQIPVLLGDVGGWEIRIEVVC